MSTADQQSGAGRREVAYRLFAAEYDDAAFQYSDSDEERAPNYVVTPTGARANRLFVVGVLTEIESVSEGVLRARVADPSGAFVLYAGQYQPDAVTFLEQAEPPIFVAVTGKARTYRPEDGDRVLTSVRPESINEVDAATRDRWTVQTAAHTIDRVATMAAARERGARGDALRDALVADGIDYGLADGIALALEHYDTTGAYLAAVRTLAIQAAELVADDRDEVDPLGIDPGEGADRTVEAPLTAGLDGAIETAATASGSDGGTGDAERSTVTATEPGPTPEPDAEAGSDPEREPAPDATDDDGGEAEAAAEPEPEPGPDGDAATAAGDTADAGDGIGDFADYEPGSEADPEPEESPSTGELYEYDEEEREEIEAEFGTDFSTGTEVDEPGAADIDTPGEGDADTTAPTDAGTADVGAEPDARPDEPESDPEPTAEEASPAADAADGPDEGADEGERDGAEAVDLTEAVVEAMDAIDEGDGADRDAVIEAVTGEYGVDAAAVEDAIDDALMSGRCYEPGDGRLKAI